MRSGTEAVTGTPPLLVDLPGASIENVFWKPGVVDAIAGGTATPEQCNEFWAGTHDGDSGGMGACNMAENVGYSFANIVGGDSSLCYMKRFPTHANLAAGAITVVAGTFPDGDVSRLFSVPAGSDPRIVKVTVSGDPGGNGDQGGDGGGTKDIFLRIYSLGQNQAAGNFYNVDIWYCKGGPGGAANGFDHIAIEQSGHLVAESTSDGDGEGAYVSTVEGFLTFGDGTIAYDTTHSRHAQVASTRGTSAGYKGDVEYPPGRRPSSPSPTRHRRITARASRSPSPRSRALDPTPSASSPAPSWVATARTAPPSTTSAVRRSSAPATTPPRRAAISYSSPAGENLDTDDFFATAGAPSVDASGFDCTTTPDVAVALDFANPTMRAAIAPMRRSALRRHALLSR